MEETKIYEDYCRQCSLLGAELDYRSVKLHECVECYASLAKNMARVDLIDKYRRK